MEGEKSITAVEDKGLSKAKHPLDSDDGDGGGGDKPESGKRPKIEETKPPQSSKSDIEVARACLLEYFDYQQSISSDIQLAKETRQLVPKDSDVEALLNSIIYRMKLKSLTIGELMPMNRTSNNDVIPLGSPLRLPRHPPIPPEFCKINLNLFRDGVSDEELVLELQAAVHQKEDVLSESCVNSVAKLLGRFQDIRTRLKELEDTTKSEPEELESKEDGSENLNLLIPPGEAPGSINLKRIPGSKNLELTFVLPDYKKL